MTDGVVGAVIGGFLAGIAGVITSFVSHHLEKRRADQEKKEKVKTFLLSILSEIETLWQFYMEGVGEKLDSFPENPEEPFRWLWPIQQDYFTIFNSNAYMIGEIEESILRDKIIMAYNGGKSLIDQFHFHNDRLNELCELEGQEPEDKDSALKYAAQCLVMKTLLIDDAKRLKETHVQVKEIIANEETGLISILRKTTNPAV
jgi:hypothetical protein